MWVHIVYLDEEIFFYNMVNDFTVLACVLFAAITHLLVIVSEPMVRATIVLTRGLTFMLSPIPGTLIPPLEALSAVGWHHLHARLIGAVFSAERVL